MRLTPSLVIVVRPLGIGIVWPLSTMPEGPMITVDPPFSVMVVVTDGIGIVEPSITIASGELAGDLFVVESGATVRVEP